MVTIGAGGARLGCVMTPEGEEPFMLELGQVADTKSYSGRLVRGSLAIDISSHNELEGGSKKGVIGYQFLADGAVVGAVQVNGKEGNVWLRHHQRHPHKIQCVAQPRDRVPPATFAPEKRAVNLCE